MRALFPAARGQWRLGRVRCNLATVDFMPFLQWYTSKLTGKGTHTLDLPPKDFFLNCVKQAILVRSVWSKQWYLFLPEKISERDSVFQISVRSNCSHRNLCPLLQGCLFIKLFYQICWIYVPINLALNSQLFSLYGSHIFWRCIKFSEQNAGMAAPCPLKSITKGWNEFFQVLQRKAVQSSLGHLSTHCDF